MSFMKSLLTAIHIQELQLFDPKFQHVTPLNPMIVHLLRMQ